MPGKGNITTNNLPAAEIDFVLVWQAHATNVVLEANRARKRRTFEANLRDEGLLVSEEELYGMHFVKVTVPIEVLMRYAEILQTRLPMKEDVGNADVIERVDEWVSELKQKNKNFEKKLRHITKVQSWFDRKYQKYFGVDLSKFPPLSQNFTAVYNRDKEYLFDSTKSDFFRHTTRTRILFYILERNRFVSSDEDSNGFGIKRMFREGIYTAFYPLHDGLPDSPGSIRRCLIRQWSGLRNLHRHQPLDYIRDYLGIKIGLYFAWLGFYTYMLLIATAASFLAILYPLALSGIDPLVKEVCNASHFICPRCDKYCDYTVLRDFCSDFKYVDILDNGSMVLFSFFMSIWSVLFPTLWLRYSAGITSGWDLQMNDGNQEQPRPQYLAKLEHSNKFKINYVTNTVEPDPSWLMKWPRYVCSISVVFLLVLLNVAIVLGIIMYRISMKATLSVYGHQTSSLTIFFSSSIINLILIVLMGNIYTILANYLTELELPRTQSDFEDSLTVKLYLLQFVNFYFSIFYIALYKGNFIGRPGRYRRLFRLRQEECPIYGCFLELCIQLTIVMTLRQFVSGVGEMASPWVKQWYRKHFGKVVNVPQSDPQMVHDLSLLHWDENCLFYEYIEMVIQFGFVSLFVAGYPLAPLFALLNNILEIRGDATKLLYFYRRPVNRRAVDIGVWLKIIDAIGKFSVLTNALLIAFTSDFVSRTVYRLSVSPNYSLKGYLNQKLSLFSIADFEPGTAPLRTKYPEVTHCFYEDQRHPPGGPNQYEYTSYRTQLMMYRFMFVVAWENAVSLATISIKWFLRPVSKSVRERIQREEYITKEMIVERERKRDAKKR